MIDIDTITDSLIGIIRDAVGNSLSKIGPTGTEYPAVIKDRENGTAPDYPYIVVDYLNEENSESWNTDQVVDAFDNVEYSTDKNLLFRVTCYGVGGQQIISSLVSKLQFESFRRRLRTESGAAFQQESGVKPSPQLKSVEYIDNGFVDLTLSYVDVEADTNSEIIETIEVNAIGSEGGVYDSQGNKIQDINVNVP